MFCIECGKKNPDGAKFCAFCGAKLFTGEENAPEAAAAVKEPAAAVQEVPAAAKEPSAPAKEPAAAVQEPSGVIRGNSAAREKAASAESADASADGEGYVRQRKYKTVQPLFENPAQPDREPKPVFRPEPAQIEPAEPGSFEPEPDEEDEAVTLPPFGEDDLWQEPAAPERGWDEPADRPDAEKWWTAPSDKEDAVEPPEDLWAGAEDEPVDQEIPEKKKFTFPWQKKREEDMVLTADGAEEMPARKPIISRKKRDTRVPERIVRPAQPEESAPEDDEEAQDIFFMRPKKQRPAREDETLDDAYVNSRVRSILLGIAFVACLFAAVWLFATDSGQMFLAGFNLSSSAEAYRDLGDSARANNQIKRAAEAYYRALSLDPQDYDTALLVGKTQQQIGEYDTAADAYYMCTQLRPTEREPYEALVQLYEIQHEPEKADYFRELGLIHAGADIE